jgi:hypothetical protein
MIVRIFANDRPMTERSSTTTRQFERSSSRPAATSGMPTGRRNDPMRPVYAGISCVAADGYGVLRGLREPLRRASRRAVWMDRGRGSAAMVAFGRHGAGISPPSNRADQAVRNVVINSTTGRIKLSALFDRWMPQATLAVHRTGSRWSRPAPSPTGRPAVLRPWIAMPHRSGRGFTV